MLTKKELCQCILLKAQQKFSKPMTDLDVYYAGPEVGLALAFLGMIQDPSTLDYVKNTANSSILYKHGNGRTFTCLELLNMLPQDFNIIKEVQEKEKEVVEDNKEPEKEITWDDLKQAIGERSYYRLLDLMESLNTKETIEATISALKGKLNAL